MALTLALLAHGSQREIVPRTVDAPRTSPAAAASVLKSLVVAVQDHDPVALGELAPRGDRAAIARLRGIGDNAELLDMRGVTARFVDQVGAVAADGSWTGVVDLTWRFGDIDRSPARAEVLVSFTPDRERLAITGFEGRVLASRGRTPLWLSGPLSVVTTPESVVLVDGTPDEARTVAGRVTRGIGVVHRVLTDWQARVVVEVPASAADLNQALGVPPGTYDDVAAVTTTVDGSRGAKAPVHVFVNPDVSKGLGGTGADVVMSHELVHVATMAATASVEPWLMEGFADYVALRDVGLPDNITLGRAISVARRDGVPNRLPGPSEFDTRADDLQAVYEQSWLACRIIAERVGEQGLMTLYRAASAGSGVDEELHKAGLEPDDLVRAWRGRLQGLVQ